MLFKQAGEYILNKLRNELPAQFTYHSIDHVQDVYQAAEQLGKQENITVTEMELLLTAACYHDAGFLKGPAGHEEESCRIANSVLPGFEYNAAEVNQVCSLIQATRLPQSPKNHLEQILADADLDYLGRDDFFEISDKLYQELSLAGVVGDLKEWDKAQVKFIEQHHYFTQTAINTRQAQKEVNLAKVKARIKQTAA
jgi:uncharacterized protein